MKDLKNIWTFDLKDSIETINDSKPLIEKILEDKNRYIFMLVYSFLASKLLYEDEKELIYGTAIFLGCLLLTRKPDYRKKENIEELKEELIKFLETNKEITDLNINDFYDIAIVNSKSDKNYKLHKENLKKGKRKKVVSHIALTKEDKLIIFKQIVELYKRTSFSRRYIKKTEIYLLNEKDMKKEGFINSDNTPNKENKLIKKLYKNENK